MGEWLWFYVPQCLVFCIAPGQPVVAVLDLGLHGVLVPLEVHDDTAQPLELLVDIVEGRLGHLQILSGLPKEIKGQALSKLLWVLNNDQR